MRYSRVILFSTLSAFALLTASATSEAFSPSVTDMGLLKPHGAWHVGAVNAQNASYCAMVNQYDKEISLAFARNPSGFGSLAIDFPGGILETGMTYEVTMQVDDLDARQFNVRAASPRSIIVQIGQDEDFYSSLGSNGTLHIALPTIDMKFDLKKFSSSYISLISCADKLLLPHDGPRTAALPVPPVEKQALDKTAAAAKTPAAPIKLTAEKSPAAPAEKISSAAAVHKPDIVWAQAEKKEPVRDIVAEENSELKNKLARADSSQSELRNEINALKTEKESLQTRLDMQDKQSKLLEAALSGKERDLSSVRSMSIADSRSLAGVQTELDNLKRDHATVVADLQTKLAEATEHYDMLQKQFTDIKEVSRSAETQASQSQSELDLARQRLSQALSQLAATEQQKNEQAAQIEAQTQQNKTLFDQMKAELGKARGEIAMLQNKMMSVTMQRDDLASQVDSQTKQNNTLQAAIEAKEKKLPLALPEQNLDAEYVTQAATPSALPPPLPDFLPLSGPGNGNLSSSKKGYLPAITPQVIRTTDENWDTVVVQ